MTKLVGCALVLASVVTMGCSGNSRSLSGSGGHPGSGNGGSPAGGISGAAGGSAGGAGGRVSAAGGSAGGAGGGVSSAGGSAGRAGGGGGAGGSGGGAGGRGGGAGSPVTLAQLCGSSGAAGAGVAAGLALSPLTFTNQTYVGDPRVIPTEAIFSFINSADDPHLQTLRLHNAGTAAVEITALKLVDNPAAPPSSRPTPTLPGRDGGTLFPLTYNQVSLPDAFKATTARSFPQTLEAGADLDVSVQFLSTRTNPPDRMLNIGGQAASAVLVAQTTAGCATAGLYAVSLWNNSELPPDALTGAPSNNWARYEPTFGQIVATLGYKVNLGSQFIQLLNTNDMSIPGVGFSTEEVQVHEFVKADPSAPVELLSMGRFSPPTDCSFGWYIAGSLNGASAAGGAGGGAENSAGGAGGGAGAPVPAPTVTDAQPAAIPTGMTADGTRPAPLRVVATMVASPLGVDWNRSNYSEMLLPPLAAGSNDTTFDPGASTAFGIWAFTNQRSVGGVSSAGAPAPNPGNGDYVYSEDTLNLDATHSHRSRVYPLRDRAGALVPHGYLLGWEEATNGDYQDYVFVLKNVSPAP